MTTKHLQEVDVPISVQRAILQDDIQAWRNTRYQVEVRLRVQKRIDADQATLDGLQKDLERCEKALDALTDEMRMIDASI